VFQKNFQILVALFSNPSIHPKAGHIQISIGSFFISFRAFMEEVKNFDTEFSVRVA